MCQLADGTISKSVHSILVYLCAKIGAFNTKRTILMIFDTNLPHYMPLDISNKISSLKSTKEKTVIKKDVTHRTLPPIPMFVIC